MEALNALLDGGFIVQEEYEQRKAALAAQGAALGASDGMSLASSFGVPLESYDYLSRTALTTNVGAMSAQAPKYESGSVEYETKPSESQIASITSKNRQSRSLRLFISSTCKDMTQEREILVKKTFPEIRRLCASRLVNFVYVDFRWGITSEESAGGKVLDLCLSEIDKCRPYFLGILGHRYGWSQQVSSISDRVLSATFDEAMEKHPWVDSYRDRSITELEMLHGALFHPSQSPNALFYLRDASYMSNMDTIQKRDYEPQSNGEQERMADLRARIEASPLSCQHYATLDQFADRVLQDLKNVIDRDFPMSEAKDLDEWDLQRQAQWNAAFSHHDIYVPRSAYETAFSRLVEDSHSPLIAVVGPVGSGKTALVSHWATHMRTSSAEKESPSTNTPYIMLRNIGQFTNKIYKIVMSVLFEIKRAFDIKKAVPADKDEVVHSLSEWLTMASMKRPIVLVFDGVEKLESTAQTLNWLPLVFPPNVHVILTCPDDTKPMEEIHRREAKGMAYAFPLGDMKESERREMANKFLDQYSKKLAHEQLYLLTSARKSGNPLFLRSVLEQLRTFGDYDRLTEYLTNLTASRSLEELLEKCVKQWMVDFNSEEYPTFVQDMFGCLYASRGGLLESELAAILSIPQQSVWASLLDATSFVLRNQAGLISFSNTHIKTAIRSICFAGADDGSPDLELQLTKYRRMILTFFKEKRLSQRKIYEYPHQVVALNSSSTLPSFLADLHVFSSLYTDGKKLDLFSYWQAAGDKADVASIYKTAIQSADTASIPISERGPLLSQLGEFLHEYGKASEAGWFYDEALKQLEPTFGVSSIPVAELLHKYAKLKETLGLYPQALELAKHSHEIFERRVGAESPSTADAVWLQGLLMKKMNRYEEAIELFQKALGVAEQYYGPSHPTVAVYLRTLADVYRNQALYEQAQSLYERALLINRNTFGEVHPEVAEVLTNLGRIEKKKGSYDLARPLYEKAVAILIQLFGNQHMVVADVYVQMGDVYRKIGEHHRCEELYKRALDIERPQLGEDHPDVGEIYYLLSLSYKQTGRYEESMECSKKAIAIAEQAFGADHLKVASPLSSLADVYSSTAKYSEAIDLYKRALAINESKLGRDHPECSENLNALGMICKKRGRYNEAREYYVRSLEIVEKVFGPNHPKVAIYLDNLGMIYRKLKMHEAANEAFQRAMKINVETFGADHPIVAENMIGIALAIVKSGGNLDEARDLFLKTIEIFSEKLGPSHEKVALSLNYLAEVYRKQGLFGRGYAETTYDRALKINQQCYGEFNDHPEIAENMNGLAQVYKAQLNYTKAEPMFKAAIAMSERTLGLTHPHVINRYRNLAVMYEAQGSIQLAQDNYAKVEQLKAQAAAENL